MEFQNLLNKINKKRFALKYYGNEKIIEEMDRESLIYINNEIVSVCIPLGHDIKYVEDTNGAIHAFIGKVLLFKVW